MVFPQNIGVYFADGNEYLIPPHGCVTDILVEVAGDVIGVDNGFDCIVVLPVKDLPGLVLLIVILQDQCLDSVQLM